MINLSAQSLNEQPQQSNAAASIMLSDLGQNMFHPKGILSQSAEAKSTTYNATTGMATNKDGKMFTSSLDAMLNDLTPDEVFPYAPPQGTEKLRDLWQQKMLHDNPELSINNMSLPIATNTSTHGLSLVGDLLVSQGDTILLPEHNWGNYKLVFNMRNGANLQTHPIFDKDGYYTTDSLIEALQSCSKDKAIMILNYPNNPIGYTPTHEEVTIIVDATKALVDEGTKVIAAVDDAHYGLFYEGVHTQSLFTALPNLNSNAILPVRLDGATKESFVWGFHVGSMTLGTSDQTTKEVLETEARDLIRSNISSRPFPTQSVAKHILKNNKQFDKEIEQNTQTLKERYEVTKEAVYVDQYHSHWQAYDFSSGYFMMIRVHDVNPGELRKHSIEKYPISVVVLNTTDIRIAFSCIEKEDTPHVFDSIAKAISDLR